MDPVLFLFMIMAFSETLAFEWKDMGLNIMLLRMWTNSPRDFGSLKGQLPKTFSEGVVLELFKILYVDDGAFLFEYQEQLTLGAQLIFGHFNVFGMDMHIRRGGESSNTEFVFFPPLGLFKKKHIFPAS